MPQLRQTQIDAIGTWYAIRLSSFDELDINVTKNIFDFYRYVISEEGDGITTKYHQHIILDCPLSTDEIRSLIKKSYPNCVGNKCIYIKACADKTQLMKYTLKEGKYCYKGFSDKFIEEHFKCSKPKTDLKKEISNNEDNFVLGKIDDIEFVENYLKIKVSHDQPIYLNHIRAYVLKMMLKAGYKKYSSLSRNILDGLNS